MNHKQIEALIYLSRNGNFARAAEMLYFDSDEEDYVTPEALQYRLKKLEEELNVSLYKRAPGASRVVLTREGNLFLREAISFYERYKQWRNMFTAGGQNTFSFAATELVVLHRLVEPIRTFGDEHPGIRLEVRTDTPEGIEAAVRDGQVDFGLATHPPDDPELEYVVWRTSRIVIITPRGHELTKLKKVTLDDVSKYPLIMLSHDMSRRDDRARIDMVFRRERVAHNENIRMVMTNSEMIACYVEAGMGIGIVSDTCLQNTHRAIERVDAGNLFGTSEVGVLVRREKVITPAMQRFFTLLGPHIGDWARNRKPPRGETPSGASKSP